MKKFNIILVCLLLLICGCHKNKKKIIINQCFDKTGWHNDINIPCDSLDNAKTNNYFIYWNDGKVDSIFAYVISIDGIGGRDSLSIEPLKNKIK